jgi:ADP-heptose:LPS heptosyltransferase
LNPPTVHWIDKNLGRPLCLFLTLHRKFVGFLRKNNNFNKKISKILFLKLTEQGSTVLTYPALREAVNMVGKENVYFLVFKENRFILDILDIINSNNIIEVNSENFIKFTYSIIRGIAKVKKEKIDVVVDMEFFSRASAIFAYLTSAEKRVGLHLFTCEGPYRGDLFTHKMIYNPYLHASQFFLTLIEVLKHNIPTKNCPMSFEIPEHTSNLPRFSPPEHEKKSLMQKIKNLKQSKLNRPIIILNPNAGDLLPIRKWPEENFMQLGKMILENFPDATIIISGSPKEKETADMIALRIGGNTVSLAGHTSLRELLSLYCISDVLITNDSGPAHFSALTPIKAVILFGPETPILYGPLSKNAIALTPNLICSPCVNVFNHRKAPCKYGLCLTRITPEEVFDKVKNFIKQ